MAHASSFLELPQEIRKFCVAFDFAAAFLGMPIKGQLSNTPRMDFLPCVQGEHFNYPLINRNVPKGECAGRRLNYSRFFVEG